MPTREQESVRDLVRAREDLREDVLRLLKFLLRHGEIFDDGKHWTKPHWGWLHTRKFGDPLLQVVFDDYLARLESTLERKKALEQEIERVAETKAYKPRVARLRCLRGIDTLMALALLAELYDFKRFQRAPEFMAFVGLVPSERSSGGKQRSGGITKTGNSLVRRLLIQAAWHCRRSARPRSPTMLRRWKDQPPKVVAHAQQAQERLHRRFQRLTARGKPSQVVVMAVARELAGFVWAIGCGDE